MDKKPVDIQPAIQSVTNWTQIVGLIVSVAAYFKLDVSPQDLMATILGIQSLVAVITVIYKTYFSKTVTPAVAAKLP